MIKAHRFAWVEANGAIPPGIMVCHRCDNPACVRHLFLGTAMDNLRDASRKGRLRYSPARRAARCGEGNPNARLTWELVRDIRQRRRAGATYLHLSRHFSLGMGTLAAVILQRTWKE